jgi:hypothetical protein
VYDIENNRDLGHVIIPEGINVPPSLSETIEIDSAFPNCQMLHSNLAVAWSIFAPSMTIQLIGNIEENDYIGFGVSKQGASKMVRLMLQIKLPPNTHFLESFRSVIFGSVFLFPSANIGLDLYENLQ